MGELNDMGYSRVGVKNKIRLPDLLNPFSENGDSAYLDITRAIPGGMPFSANRGGVGQVSFLPESMQPGFGALRWCVVSHAWHMISSGVKRYQKVRGLELHARNFLPNVPVGEIIGKLTGGMVDPESLPFPSTYAGNKIALAEAGQGSRYQG